MDSSHGFRYTVPVNFFYSERRIVSAELTVIDLIAIWFCTSLDITVAVSVTASYGQCTC